MHHLRGNAIPAGHVQNPLSDSDEISCRRAWIRSCVPSFKQRLNIIGIVVYVKRENFEFLGKNCPKGRIPLSDFLKTKLGVGEGVPGPPPGAKFHHRRFRNVGLSPSKLSRY